MADNYIGNAPGLVLSDTTPIGAILWSHRQPDASWLVLNGQTVSKVMYPDLWSFAQGFLTADQTANPGLYLSVDANNFKLPKLDGLFIRAQGSYDANRVAGALGVKQDDQNKFHSHALNGSTPNASVGGSSWGSGTTLTVALMNNTSPVPGTGVDAGGTEARPINVALVPCVKALKNPLPVLPATTAVVASQPEMEAATALDKFVAPGNQHQHPGMAKAWVTFTGIGSAVIRSAYNVSGVVRNAAGDYTITFTVPFSSGLYVPVLTTDGGGARIIGPVDAATSLPGSCRIVSRQTTDAAPNTDANVAYAAFFGDQ